MALVTMKMVMMTMTMVMVMMYSERMLGVAGGNDEKGFKFWAHEGDTKKTRKDKRKRVDPRCCVQGRRLRRDH